MNKSLKYISLSLLICFSITLTLGNSKIISKASEEYFEVAKNKTVYADGYYLGTDVLPENDPNYDKFTNGVIGYHYNNINDGLYYTEWGSDAMASPSIKIDLGEEYPITRVDLTSRYFDAPGGTPYTVEDFSIEFSNDLSFENCIIFYSSLGVAIKENGNEWQWRQDTFKIDLENCHESYELKKNGVEQKYRYVRYNKNSKWVALAEIEVFIGGKEFSGKRSQSIPSTPTLAYKTQNSIKVKPIEKCEFAIREQDSDVELSYKSSLLFENLKDNTYYNIYSRRKETDMYKASLPSPALKVATLKNVANKPKLEKITVKDKVAKITIKAMDDCQYGIATELDGEVIMSLEPVFENLEEGEKYYIFARKKGGTVKDPNAWSEALIVNAKKYSSKNGCESILQLNDFVLFMMIMLAVFFCLKISKGGKSND